MSIHAQTLIGWLEKIAPKRFAEDWDNVGLLVGSLQKHVSRVMLTLDVTEEVVNEAVELDCQLIIAHHPIIFKPLKAVRTDLEQGKVIETLIKSDIAVYAAHTNLDVSPEGVNQVLAELLELTDLLPLKIVGHDQLFKLVVYVPIDHVEQVRFALGRAGAGHIGNYSNCTFSVAGNGTFLPESGAVPFIGSVGKLEQVREERLETVVPESLLNQSLRAMLKAHPYEEVAYDVIPLHNQDKVRALGLIGSLRAEVSLRDFAELVKQRLGVSAVRIAGDPSTIVRKVAVAGGSGGSLVYNTNGRADVLLTGDVAYHQAVDATAFGLAVVDAGHYYTEWPILQALAKRLLGEMQKNGAEILISQRNRDIWNVI